MNTELRSMIVNAECRYLLDDEVRRVRDYASGMAERMAAARRLELAEAAIVDEAVTLFARREPAYLEREPSVRETLAHELKLTLRYVALAHVRDDMAFFKKSFAAWVGELLRATVEPTILVASQRCLRDAVEARLDPADARALVRYVDAYIEELGR